MSEHSYVIRNAATAEMVLVLHLGDAVPVATVAAYSSDESLSSRLIASRTSVRSCRTSWPPTSADCCAGDRSAIKWNDMPIWGPMFSMYEGGDELGVRRRIKNLCKYLAFIQDTKS